MGPVLKRASRNFLWQHPWQLALAILGITLGVAVVISIDLAMESAFNSFDQATRAISGQATHKIIGNAGTVDEKLYTRLRVEQGIQNLSPIVYGTVGAALKPDLKLKLYGIDPLVEGGFRSTWRPKQNSINFGGLLTQLITVPNTVLISQQLAEQLKLGIGDDFVITTPHGNKNLRIIEFLTAGNALSRQALEKLLITDIASAQELLNSSGVLNTIDVMLDDDDSQAALLKKIRTVLPSAYQLITYNDEIQSMRQMTRAFAINLTALGLLSMLIGMFLIYNTMTFLVVQRRQLIGSLRAIGVTRREIFTMIVSEAGILALIGTTAGILMGIVMAQSLLQLVSSTINAIYFEIDAAALSITPWQIGKGALLGLSVTLLAVLLPAWEATKTPPNAVLSRAHLESTSLRLSNRAGLAGFAFILIGMVIILFSQQSITLGLISIFLILFGFALMTPNITLILMRWLEPLMGRFFGILGKLPPRMVAAQISRTGIAIAALMIAVAATIGMDLMINSFRQTVAQWLKISLRADLYIHLPDNTTATNKILADHELKNKLAELPGVQMLSSVLHTHIIADDKKTQLAVFEINPLSKAAFILKQAQHGPLWQRFDQQPTLLITEPYAYHHNVKPGATLYLTTASGQQPFTVIGIYADYSGDRGHLAMSRGIYQRYWPDAGFSGIGIYAQPDTDLNALSYAIEELLQPHQRLRSNDAIYKASMQIFEQTFLITHTLRWLAAGIAFVGVFSALMALQFERTRELGVLRAIGITPRQLSAMIISETGLMGLVAGIFAIPIGYIVATLLIFVIYQRSFGWTMEFYVTPGVFTQGLALALIAALLAGIFPALKMAETRPAEALRSE
jgi:putative ABC transport system permease protein